ncbi:MAG: FKBP-type peptidyl-prolyl cis-trans isomerase [Ferruginibacter sp.]
MRKFTYVVLLATLSLTACKEESFKKGGEDLEYKIISSGSGPTVKYGDFIQMHISQFYNKNKKDSVLSDSRKMAPIVEMLDSINTPKQYYDILKQLRKGDSLVIRILTDSAFKKSPESMPPFIKKGNYLVTTVKVLNVFTDKTQADSARNASMAMAQENQKKEEEVQLVKDDAKIKDYLSKNNVQAVKAPLGTYVQVIQPGTGANIDTSVVAKINYTGKTLEGKAFDSNVEPSFNHVEPLLANMTNDPSLGITVIRGWSDGLKLLNKGAKAKLYVPSSLAYGAQGAGPDIPPFTTLVFDVEVVDVLSRAQAKTAADAQQKKTAAMQKRFTDSISKANPAPANK